MTTNEIPTGLSVWEQDVYQLLIDHVAKESQVVDQYDELLEGSTDHVRFLLELIVEDELRHHALYDQWAATFKSFGSFVEPANGVPDLGRRWSKRPAAVRAGFTVMACGFRGDRCPALRGEPCPLAKEADAIVVAFPRGDVRGQALLKAHEQLHGSVPVVVEEPAQGFDDHARCRLVSGGPSPELRSALGEVVALYDQG